MDRIGDNDDFGNIILGTYLIDATPNHKEFHFSGHD